MTTKYFKSVNGNKVFKIEGRDLVKNNLEIMNTSDLYLEIKENDYNSLIERRTGRSTRAIDWFIQELFDRGETIVVDHHETQSSHIFLLHRVLKRLEFEHSDAFRRIEVKGLKIKFKQEN